MIHQRDVLGAAGSLSAAGVSSSRDRGDDGVCGAFGVISDTVDGAAGSLSTAGVSSSRDRGNDGVCGAFGGVSDTVDVVLIAADSDFDESEPTVS